MLERDKIINLYDIYKNLLTNKQKKYFEEYYFEDLSLTEISNNNDVSKAIVSKTLNIIINKLNNYEEILNILDKTNKINELIIKIDDKKLKKEFEKIIEFESDFGKY